MERLVLEGATMKYRNFSGTRGDYNPEGRRTFCVVLDPVQARELEEKGWNIRWPKPKSDQDESIPLLNIAVRFENFPPKIVIINGGRKSVLTEGEVAILDWAEIELSDLIISGSRWDVNGKQGIKAYLKTAYITLHQDEFEEKYYDAPDSAASAVGGCGHCEECTGQCHCHEN